MILMFSKGATPIALLLFSTFGNPKKNTSLNNAIRPLLINAIII